MKIISTRSTAVEDVEKFKVSPKNSVFSKVEVKLPLVKTEKEQKRCVFPKNVFFWKKNELKSSTPSQNRKLFFEKSVFALVYALKMLKNTKKHVLKCVFWGDFIFQFFYFTKTEKLLTHFFKGKTQKSSKKYVFFQKKICFSCFYEQ